MRRTNYMLQMSTDDCRNWFDIDGPFAGEDALEWGTRELTKKRNKYGSSQQQYRLVKEVVTFEDTGL